MYCCSYFVNNLGFNLLAGSMTPTPDLPKKETSGSDGVNIEKGELPKSATKKDIICIDDD